MMFLNQLYIRTNFVVGSEQAGGRRWALGKRWGKLFRRREVQITYIEVMGIITYTVFISLPLTPHGFAYIQICRFEDMEMAIWCIDVVWGRSVCQKKPPSLVILEWFIFPKFDAATRQEPSKQGANIPKGLTILSQEQSLPTILAFIEQGQRWQGRCEFEPVLRSAVGIEGCQQKYGSFAHVPTPHQRNMKKLRWAIVYTQWDSEEERDITRIEENSADEGPLRLGRDWIYRRD